ncbi:unnamed protein product (macronuclear) [Paramecium tetraurelia]|uniref:Uncharacterized protein n=1 Tax=Paramecium tetraurelia TaxID=5888 RepID=A0EC70_PARTE|nr:uncharacterized protein GSPATT00025623001 [Paramecium tetraurelia]CAK92887.1 unnamed protein product [Paramecium tetraurelia]|eukprot:XP_001460284.1 hypothetical protein (macronuclear) [Paramecium tetraurelia strain d4-2]
MKPLSQEDQITFMYKDFRMFMKIKYIYMLFMINMHEENKSFYFLSCYKPLKKQQLNCYIYYYWDQITYIAKDYFIEISNLITFLTDFLGLSLIAVFEFFKRRFS